MRVTNPHLRAMLVGILLALVVVLIGLIAIMIGLANFPAG